jgi:hypothetical protein
MIRTNVSNCPDCGGYLEYYDRVSRIVKIKGGTKKQIYLRRLKCDDCHKLHRELPNYIFPYKQYEAEIIKGVREGLITSETLGYEDYPCEMTMSRWTLK